MNKPSNLVFGCTVVVLLLLTSLLASTVLAKDYTADVVIVGAGGAGMAAEYEAASRGASVIVAELDSGGGAQHPQSGPFAATGATARSADVYMRLLFEHHVDQQVVVYEPLIRRAKLLEETVALAGVRHDFVALVDHFQSVVVTDGHAFGASLALAGIDDDRELAPFA